MTEPTREDYERAAQDAGKVAAALRYKRQNPVYADALDQWASLLTTAAERMTWRPMGTAPEDDFIIGAWPDGKRWRAAQLFLEYGEWVDVRSDAIERPTHWLPLPPAPQQDEPSAEEGA